MAINRIDVLAIDIQIGIGLTIEGIGIVLHQLGLTQIIGIPIEIQIIGVTSLVMADVRHVLRPWKIEALPEIGVVLPGKIFLEDIHPLVMIGIGTSIDPGNIVQVRVVIGKTRDIVGIVPTVPAVTAKIHDIVIIGIANTEIGIAETGILAPTIGPQSPPRTKSKI